MTPDHRPRFRDIGMGIGVLSPGNLNAITDVPGVSVGQVTVSSGHGQLRAGEGPARTGVTVILPHQGNLFRERVPAAVHVFNGFGKCMGLEQVAELGQLETPIGLTSTLCVGRVADALVSHAIRENAEIGISLPTVNPFVGECSDAWLNDIQGRHVGETEVMRAIDGATQGAVDEGSVGAGTGMSAYGFKGGIGTSSRVISPDLGGWTVGVLVLANFGRPRDLRIDGVPVGRLLDEERDIEPERGSIMMIVGTDAPCTDRILGRIARRAVLGMARTGSMGGHGSGDVVVAFSASPLVRMPLEADGWTLRQEIVAEHGIRGASDAIDALFAATVEATEEAILNALFKATTVVGRDGHVREAIPVDNVVRILRDAGRL
ncbi:MAG: P1 family peptidase [Thermomicrobiales bacterium]|nr:P1 family peptidase [Thermomicrobiales bacterium]